jgi:RNA polymerase sigma-70 factor (ECF subfamily)
MQKADAKSLVRRLSRFDEEAWAAFCKEFAPVLGRHVQYRFGCDADRAEEIVQMTFVRCIRSIASFDPSRGSMLDWLKAIASNEARTTLKAQARLRTGGDPAVGSRSPLAAIVDCMDRQPLPDELLARKDVQNMVAQCLVQLPPRQRQVLVMKYQEDLKVSEMARRLSLSEKAVESLLSRSREAFRNALSARAAASKLTVGDMQT